MILRSRLRIANALPSPFGVGGRARYSSRVVQEHDVLLFRQKGPRQVTKYRISPPIRKDTTIKLGYGATVDASKLLGQPIPAAILDSEGRPLRVKEVTLAQYLTNQPRVATPIYPHDASLIVSILDINLPVPGEDPIADAQPPTEIFEAGTGMGSLTLHIARVLHGANPPVPPELKKAMLEAPYKEGMLLRNVATDDSPIHGPMPHAPELDSPELEAKLEAYRASRRAILHTLDISPSSNRQAHGVVRNFARGRYVLDVDFHVRTIRSFFEWRLAENGRQPFLSHAVLDLPGSSKHADLVVEALKPDGRLVVFFPSVTQVLEFVVWAEDTKQPLFLDRVVELEPSSWAPGFTDSVGGREWDIRVVTPKKQLRKQKALESESSDAVLGEADGETTKVHVCRPKVGNYVGGGGFLGVFSKRPPQMEDETGLDEEATSEGPEA